MQALALVVPVDTAADHAADQMVSDIRTSIQAAAMPVPGTRGLARNVTLHVRRAHPHARAVLSYVVRGGIHHHARCAHDGAELAPALSALINTWRPGELAPAPHGKLLPLSLTHMLSLYRHRSAARARFAS